MAGAGVPLELSSCRSYVPWEAEPVEHPRSICDGLIPLVSRRASVSGAAGARACESSFLDGELSWPS